MADRFLAEATLAQEGLLQLRRIAAPTGLLSCAFPSVLPCLPPLIPRASGSRLWKNAVMLQRSGPHHFHHR